jgi:dienelactone hydrolase
VKTKVYAGVDHAFALPERPPYDKLAAMMAYSRVVAFVGDHGGGGEPSMSSCA